MTTPDVLALWTDPELREHIWNIARLLTHREELQAKLVAGAWFVLGEADAQRTCEYYRRLVARTMYRDREMYRYGEKRVACG